MDSSLDRYRIATEKHHKEDRTEEQFREELEEWADQVRSAFPDLMLDVLAWRQPAASFAVTNTCGRFLEGLELEVHIDGPVIQHAKPDSLRDLTDRLPRRPRNWGPWTEQLPRYESLVSGSILNRTISAPRPNSTNFRNSGSVTALLHCDELRPGKTHTFNSADDDHTDTVLLTTDAVLANTRVTVKATARGIDDEYVVEFIQPINELVDLTPLLQKFTPHLNYFSGQPPERE